MSNRFDINKAKEELLSSITNSKGGVVEDIGDLMKKWNKKIDEVKNNFKMEFKFVNKSDNEDPAYAHDTDAGFDLRSNEDVTIQPARVNLIKNDDGLVTDVQMLPAETKIVKTGLFFELKQGFEMQIRSRSGLAAKKQVAVLNGPGTIDEGYRGEIMVILKNHGTEPFEIKKGDRIAQAILSPVTAKNSINLVSVDNISDNTDRGSNGIGSTGVS